MKFLSVCSGIEAASVAWRPLGWEAVSFSEIEPFPCAALKHHYPTVPNPGDMTKYKEWPDANFDVLCGGTPCQSFSVAGLRKGMDDPRGNLALVFLGIVDRYRPKWVVWENVPGVLSSNKGRDFGSFLGGLGSLGYGFAYRVLDAQYFGLAQRRKRVFVVGCLGDWRRAAAVLFERESLSGNPPPSRKAGKGFTHDVAPCLDASGAGFQRTGDKRGQDPVIAFDKRQSDVIQYGNMSGPLDQNSQTVGVAVEVSPTLRAGGNKTGGDRPPGTDVDTAETLVMCPAPHAEISPAIKARDGKGVSSDGDGDGDGAILVPMVAHTLRGEGFDASEDGCGRGTPIIPVGINGGETGFALRSNPSHSRDKGDGGVNTTMVVRPAMSVRRLTPKECERLQGFPDGYTAIQIKGKPAADGPRYKALGNSWAVPVVRWIGRRIEMVGEFTPGLPKTTEKREKAGFSKPIK